MIDLSYLEQVSGGDKVFIHEILGMFLHQTMPDVRSLSATLQSGDYATLASLAHRCKSAIHMLGNQQANELIVTIEQNAKSKAESALLSAQIEQLVSLADQLEQEIKAIIHKG
jgi:HPt (histidine-containing phosphotransfer) domain-containing protein